MTAPYIGQIVHYVSHGTPVREDGTQAYKSECRAAIVTTLGDHEALAGLAVLNPTGMFFHPEVQRDDGNPLPGEPPSDLCTGRAHSGGYWHFCWQAREGAAK